MYSGIAEGVKCNIYTLNEARGLCGLEPIRSEDTHGVKENLKITNCVNCGAIINPNIDYCEYCGTSYVLMGIKPPPITASGRKLNNMVGYLHHVSGIKIPIDRAFMVGESILDVYTNAGIYRRERYDLDESNDRFVYKYYAYDTFSDKWKKAPNVAYIEIF
jgi:hypothetical protein